MLGLIVPALLAAFIVLAPDGLGEGIPEGKKRNVRKKHRNDSRGRGRGGRDRGTGPEGDARELEQPEPEPQKDTTDDDSPEDRGNRSGDDGRGDERPPTEANFPEVVEPTTDGTQNKETE